MRARRVEIVVEKNDVKRSISSHLIDEIVLRNARTDLALSMKTEKMFNIQSDRLHLRSCKAIGQSPRNNRKIIENFECSLRIYFKFRSCKSHTHMKLHPQIQAGSHINCVTEPLTHIRVSANDEVGRRRSEKTSIV